ncbi:MAG TPA: SCO family protein [Nitrosospira sp.]|nr:SCO family protein [Nitrosospira sp.]
MIRVQAFRIRRYICGMIMAFLVSGCSSHRDWHVDEVAGHLPDLEFILTADDGNATTAKAYGGYVLLMYFGFTGCKAECPVSMARLAHVMQLLGDSADRVRILFVTLDPEHDAPPVLHRYIAQFDPERTVGLTGSAGDIQSLTKRYRAAYRPRSGVGNTRINHGDAVYIFDSQGHARLLATSSHPDEDVAEDIRRLLKSGI